MPSMTSLAAALVVVATLYWLDVQSALERIVAGITTDRALTAGGLGAGLVYGDMAVKAAVGFVGGVGTLAVGDVLDITGQQFALVVVVIIGLLMVSGGD